MALYAFDGTWNQDRPGCARDTNVVWFRDAYRGRVFYRAGVGTRLGRLGSIAGGITGIGGRRRVREAIGALRAHFRAGDTIVDIVGFSRGAALALHFANHVAAKGVPNHRADVAIRFLGLWDTVASFGIPSLPLALGWDLDLPDNVEKCYHALALDERRHTYRVHRLDARVADARQEGRLFEVWFRGVHSDVGGGNRNPGLSSLTLNWMFAKAQAQGLPMDPSIIARNAARMNPAARISIVAFDPIKNRFRTVRWNDQAHTSVSFRPDTRKRQHNHPPVGLALVDDHGRERGRFTRP